MAVLLTVAGWDGRTAQDWRHDKGLLLTAYSVAKKPWDVDSDTQYSQKSLCQ